MFVLHLLLLSFLFALIRCFLQLIYFNFLSFVVLDHYGGDEEIRTPDPLLARQVLSQLSYTPIMVFWSFTPN